MIKLLLTLIMVFTFGTSTVNAEENTTNIENRISELAEAKPDNLSTINAKVDELSEDELKAIIENVNELKEPTEEDLAIKEAAISKLEEEEVSPLTIVVFALGFGLIFSAFIMLFKGYIDESVLTFGVGILLVMVVSLLTKWWYSRLS